MARRRRVLVFDASDEASRCRPGKAGPLEGWRDRVLADWVDERPTDGAGHGASNGRGDGLHDGAHATPLLAAVTVTVRDVGDLLSALDEVALLTAAGTLAAPDVVLVDTAGRTDDRARVALRATDLVLAPFRNDLDAHWVRRGLRDDLPPGLPFCGLPCGVGGGSRGQRAAREAFGHGPFLHMELPEASAFLLGLWEGWLAPYRRSPREHGWERLDAHEDTGERREASRAWTAALAIAGDALGTAKRAAPGRHAAWRQGLRLLPAPAPPWLEA